MKNVTFSWFKDNPALMLT